MTKNEKIWTVRDIVREIAENGVRNFYAETIHKIEPEISLLEAAEILMLLRDEGKLDVRFEAHCPQCMAAFHVYESTDEYVKDVINDMKSKNPLAGNRADICMAECSCGYKFDIDCHNLYPAYRISDGYANRINKLMNGA